MYRIQLPSGEEALFRSLDELVVGVQNGIVTSAALVYHSKTGSWLPIKSHPHFSLARKRRQAVVRPVDGPTGTSGKPIRQSAPEARHAKARTTTAAPTPPSPPPHPTEQQAPTKARSPRTSKPAPRGPSRMSGSQPAGKPRASPTRTRTLHPEPTSHPQPNANPSASRPFKRPTRPVLVAAASGIATILWLAFGAGPGSTIPGSALAGMDPPPSVGGPPGSTAPDRYRAARRQLDEGMALLGFDSVLEPSRFATPEALNLARRTAAAARQLVAVYRAAESAIDADLGPDQRSLREPPGVAAVADSLFATIDTLYGLLEAAEGAYTVRGSILAFRDLALATEFTRRAAWLQGQYQVWQSGGATTATTVGAIIEAIGRVPQARTNF